MEDNNNRNYNQEDRNYTDVPRTTDPNQEYRKNPDQFEEFSDDHPNRYFDDEIGKHPDGMEDVDWENDDLNPTIDSLETPDPIYNPDDDFTHGGIREDRDIEDEEEDTDDEDLDEESDFDSTFNESDVDIEDEYDEDVDEDDDDEINNENSNLDDDWLNRKV